jgi:acetyl-CoA C-acetyltransferase
MHGSFSSRIASAILGREAHVGGGMQQYREAVAVWNGRDAHAEFLGAFQQAVLDRIEHSIAQGATHRSAMHALSHLRGPEAYKATLADALGRLRRHGKPLDPTTLWYWTDFGVDQAYGYHHAYDIATAYGGLPTLGYAKKHHVPMAKMDEAMYAVHHNVRIHSSKNPKAYIQTTLGQEAKAAGFKSELEFWRSRKNPFLAWPTRVKSALNTVDGASAYIISSEKEAKSYFKKEPIEVAGFHWSSSNYPWYGKDPTDWAIDKTSFDTAMRMAGITAKDIDYLDVHDCMQIYQLIEPEICGYFKKGEAWKAHIEGRTLYTGDKPMNTSGGRHGKGHAFAASAGASMYEAVKQMRGEAKGRQIKDEPEVSVVHNHGYGMHTAVTVLKR